MSTSDGDIVDPESILTFWFGDPAGADYGKPRPLWFAGGPAADAAIRAQFGDAVATALSGGFEEWRATPRGTLALVLLLDQFTRNIFRGTPRAYAGDARAQEIVGNAIASGCDRRLKPAERCFLYMPLEHAESRPAQARSVMLFEALAAELMPEERSALGIDRALDYARRHAATIERFGRFPHRNAIFGRDSTPEERTFLAGPDSSF